MYDLHVSILLLLLFELQQMTTALKHKSTRIAGLSVLTKYTGKTLVIFRNIT